MTHAGLYKHTSLGPAEEAVAKWGKEAGFQVTTLKGYEQDGDHLDLSMITPEFLGQFDGLMMMTNGNLPMTDHQKAALVNFVREGGGFVGVHCASLTFYNYAPFGELLGGYFKRPVKQGKEFILKVEDREHPATRMLGESWPLVDEFYLFGTERWDPGRPKENVDALFGHPIPVAFSRARVRVLLSIDSVRSDLEGTTDMVRGGDYPQAWCRSFGKGRSFYTALGHRDDMWTANKLFRAHLVGGIRWALGLASGNATPAAVKREAQR